MGERPHRSEPSSAGRSRDASRTVRVPWRATSVAQIRKALVDDLEARDVSAAVVDEAEIVVSELVSNAIRHARPLADGNLRVHWKVKGGVVEVEVTDGGSESTPRPAPRTIWAPSGRGLRIVRSLAHEWGVTEDRNGSTVWASLGGPSRRRSH
ncbi:ATP-binding protein [Pedococcus badiiscoriae]|nr:ATP-binding protein [Pedococcus badiiscoriae]